MEELMEIYSKYITIRLREMGHKVVKTGVNKDKPEYDTYFFKVNDKFNKDLEIAKEEFRQRRANRINNK